MCVEMGSNVQFGPHCIVSTDVKFGNNILMAGHVYFIGKNDHTFSIPRQLIWDGKRGYDIPIVIEDDVWIGYNAIIMGGNPARKRKIKDRFQTEIEKQKHIEYLTKYSHNIDR